jgi:hypothetical protein
MLYILKFWNIHEEKEVECIEILSDNFHCRIC